MSMETNLPPGLRTRSASVNISGRSETLRSTKAVMAESKIVFLKGANIALPMTKSALSPCAALARLPGAVQREVTRPCAEIQNVRLGAGYGGVDRLISPVRIKTKTDQTVKQVITPCDSIEHAPNGSVARIIDSGHEGAKRANCSGGIGTKNPGR